MFKAIPWETIGPIATAVIFILIIVFGFMLRWQKGARPPITPPNPPRDINDTHKKSLCFDHHRDIAANATAIGMISENFKEANKHNSQQHAKIFTKLEDLGKEMITEIQKINGAT